MCRSITPNKEQSGLPTGSPLCILCIQPARRAALLRIRINGFTPYQLDRVKGQPLRTHRIATIFENIILDKIHANGDTFTSRIV